MLYEVITRYLGMALDQAGRMQRLINDLLTLSALETGAPSPAEEMFDVGGIVREIGRETEALSSGRHRITSYNVCYTKLLRTSPNSTPACPCLLAWVSVLVIV